MVRIIALFNLKPGVSQADYESWARRVDLPTVNRLPSIERFELFKSAGLLGGAAAPPYEYIEVIDIRNMETFSKDVGGPVMQKVAREFSSLADPIFIVTEKIE